VSKIFVKLIDDIFRCRY